MGCGNRYYHNPVAISADLVLQTPDFETCENQGAGQMNLFKFFSKKQKHYIVVSEEDLRLLEGQIELLMKSGWKCQGGIAQGANFYLQAMVK